MKGLKVSRQGECLEEVAKANTTLRLLGKSGEVEVMQQTINAGKPITLEPWHGTEFLYIIDGKMAWDNEGSETILGPGDYVQANHMTQPAYFRTLTNVTLIYLASPPVFGYISDRLKTFVDIARKVELKDNYTEEHCRRIEKLSLQLGDKLRLSGGQIDRLVTAAYLHDIGKIEVPIEILTKPGPLTDEEWEVVKRHPVYGRQMLQDTFLAEVGYIIEQHHEREDGSGYPLGLTGKQICIEAKIIALADALDAMTTDRPYRKGLTEAAAIREIMSLSGQQFAPEVVNAFIELMREEGKLPPDIEG